MTNDRRCLNDRKSLNDRKCLGAKRVLLRVLLPTTYLSGFIGLTGLIVFTGITVLSFPVQSASADSNSAKSESKTKVKDLQAGRSFPNDVTGNWVSEWGPVIFRKNEIGTISGSWEEGKDKIGQIQSGKFDPTTGSFNFDFRETWTGLKGKATLKLSVDHGELSGCWTRGKDKGTWTMHRPNKNKNKTDTEN